VKFSKTIKIIAGFILILLVSVLLVIILHWQTNVIGKAIEVLVNAALKQQVTVHYSELKGTLFRTAIIKNLSITLPNGTNFRTNHADLDFDLSSIMHGDYQVHHILIDTLWATIESDTAMAAEASPDTSPDAIIAGVDSVLLNLPSANLGRLEVNYGYLSVPAKSLQLDSLYLSLDGRISPGDIALNVHRVTARYPDKNFRLARMGFELLMHNGRLNINKFQMRTGKSLLDAHAEISLGDSLRTIFSVDEADLELNEWARLASVKDSISGNIRGTMDFVGTPQRFSTRAYLSGQINQYPVDSLVFDGDYHYGAVNLRRARVYSPAGEIDLSSRISEQKFDGLLQFRAIDLNKILPDLLPTTLNGSIRFNMKSLSIRNLAGSGELLLHNSMVDSLPIDSLRLALGFKGKMITISPPSFVRLDNMTRFTLSGSVTTALKSELHLAIDRGRLESVAGFFGITGLAGAFDGDMYLNGILTDPDVEGFLWIPRMEAPGMELDSIVLQLHLDQLAGKRQGDASFSIANGKIADLKITSTAIDLTFDGDRIQLDTLSFNSGPNYISGSGWAAFNPANIQFSFGHLRMQYESFWLENSGALEFDYGDDGLDIESFILTGSENGLIEVRGYYQPENDDADINIFLRNLHIHVFNQLLPSDVRLDGLLEGDLEIDQPVRDLQVIADITGKDIQLNKLMLGDLVGRFHYRDERIRVDQFRLASGETLLETSGDVLLRFKGVEGDMLDQMSADLQARWNNFELSSFNAVMELPAILSGKSTGDLRLGGTVTRPELTMNLSLSGIEYDKYIISDLFSAVRYKSDTLFVDTLETGINGTTIRGSGWQSVTLRLDSLDQNFLNKRLELRLYSQDDTLQFISFLQEQIESLTGPFDMQVLIGGTPAKPKLKGGFATIHDGVLNLSRVKNPITRISARVEVQDSLMRIVSFSGYSEKEKDFFQEAYDFFRGIFRYFTGRDEPEGHVEGYGTVVLNDLLHPVIDLHVKTNELYIDYFVENTQIVFSTDDIHVTGRDTLFVQGDITLNEGSYEFDAQKFQKNLYLQQADVKGTRALSWNLIILMPGNFTVRSATMDLTNNFEINMMGDLRSVQVPRKAGMELAGHLDILSGKYGSWGQDFEIQAGTIDFQNPKVINPSLDISAERQSRDMVFVLRVSGTLEKQLLDLQVKDLRGNYQTNLSIADKITLLTLGASTADLSGANLVTAGEDVINKTVVTALERGAESVTGLDKVEIQSAGGVVDLNSLRLNNGLKDASIALGKYLTTNLYLEYKSQFGAGTIPAPKLSWEPGNQIGLTYKINRNWSVESNYQQTLRGNNRIELSLGWQKTF
jgi:hypothetical protein